LSATEQGSRQVISGAEIAQLFGLTDSQSQAVRLRQQDVAVTAGAGSGKTLTLVARYLSLLAEGLIPRRVVAITFTEKAAREMRNRVRSKLSDLAIRAHHQSQRSVWEALNSQMDSARIGTIHSLCAELLRAFPSELGIDPQFEVLDEGLAAALQVQMVQEALAWAVAQPQMRVLFDFFSIRGLEGLLAYLLARRLDAADRLALEPDPGGLIANALSATLARPEIVAPLADLRAMLASGEIQADASAALVNQLEEFLSAWTDAEKSLADGEWLACAQHLFQARREYMGGRAGGKNSRAKALLAELREAYDAWASPWLGGDKSGDLAPSPIIEQAYARTIPAVRDLFSYMTERYQEALKQRRALDFDDLEARAVDLLKINNVRAAWQAEVDAVLVDEFQDTNRRQREIVTALSSQSGQPGKLFIVGDARQSIYRFRGADVRVFRGLQDEIAQAGGRVIDLDLTFRAHAGLLTITEELLAAIMGVEFEPGKAYKIPFSSLKAFRQDPISEIEAPYLEFILGVGADAKQGRLAAAQALAARLSELKQGRQIKDWQEVCLLFRASTAFPIYEQAFENAGIPFVTVAGRGFYDRPEIRDLLNMLQALADPWNDLALAGLLRSPAFGLSDAALYRLRWSGHKPRHLWLALEREREVLDPEESARAGRAWRILSELRPQVDRLPVAEVLKKLVDATDYRSVLAAAQGIGQENSRLWRNLDKLLDDATTSKLVNVRAFLEYLTTLQAAGAREGEAPVEAESAAGGAVRLMTVHKAKGLEFNLVVIADAGRSVRGASSPAFLMAETGLAARLDKLDGDSLVYRMARWLDNQQNEAEEQRLLYVAATRAKEKWIVSGHLTPGRQGYRANGWLNDLLGATGVGLLSLDPENSENLAVTPAGQAFRLRTVQDTAASAPSSPIRIPLADRAVSQLPALYQPVLTSRDPQEELEARKETARYSWRTAGEHIQPASDVTGRMVHRALQRWMFPGDPYLEPLLESLAVENGLTDARHKAAQLEKVCQLLDRLRAHSLWAEVSAAQERYHELPYARQLPGRGAEAGFIDLLYRNRDGWHLIDFKTDELAGDPELDDAILRHRQQLQRYKQAVGALLGTLASARLCFLDVNGQIELVDPQ
jgi:ATP-dependent helicase/nuclease subunit A